MGAVAGMALACSGLTHCGNDVLVGIDRGGVPDRTALLAVRRLSSGAHVAVGWTGCVTENDPSCDGWVATTQGAFVQEAVVAAPGADLIRSIALLGDDRIVVGRHTPQAVSSAWVARRTASGGVWETPLSADAATPSDARAVDLAPDGTIVVGGNETIGGLEKAWVARLDSNGGLIKRMRLGGTPSSETATIESIASFPTNRVYVGGQVRVDVSGVSRVLPTIIELGATLDVFNSRTGIGITGVLAGSVKTLLNERPQEITACAQVDDGAGIVRLADYLTDVRDMRILTEPGVRIRVGGCTVTDDAAILIVGAVERPEGPRPWAAKVDRVSLVPFWTRIYDAEVGRLDAVAPAGGGGLAVGSSGSHAYTLAISP